jgi:hypothetical protein
MKRMWILLFVFAFTASAQQSALTSVQPGIVRVVPAFLIGDYAGSMGPLQIHLQLFTVNNGDIVGTVNGIKVDRIAVVGNMLSFRVPAIGATWTGTVDNCSLTGTWRQGSQTQPLNFRKE